MPEPKRAPKLTFVIWVPVFTKQEQSSKIQPEQTQHLFRFFDTSSIPIGSMGLVYLPTLTIKIN